MGLATELPPSQVHKSRRVPAKKGKDTPKIFWSPTLSSFWKVIELRMWMWPGKAASRL